MAYMPAGLNTMVYERSTYPRAGPHLNTYKKDRVLTIGKYNDGYRRKKS